MRALANASRAWPATTGTVREASIEERARQRPASRQRSVDYDYEIRLAYDYAVSGQAYRGTRLDAAGNTAPTWPAAVAALAGLAPGQAVTVYYDPADPRRSVLRPGTPHGEGWRTRAGWGAGLVLLGLLGAAYPLGAWRTGRALPRLWRPPPPRSRRASG